MPAAVVAAAPATKQIRRSKDESAPFKVVIATLHKRQQRVKRRGSNYCGACYFHATTPFRKFLRRATEAAISDATTSATVAGSGTAVASELLLGGVTPVP
jgi:hypothetical protein